ncbi:xanthine dehydrogenase subunit D [Paenibacillus antri]|uniref:Xanthine dehydrogenase subunit D n=1 Tax=Paenibacillus antri TaxID=2582848 RepID=A0A5R9G8K1_9BACL|nr:xanthine dehydrogenase subunit D [Paenibacillus antri]TLS52737.1 xanthine dehydrogenase subunit D [Paenibacillus antri]
MLLHRTSSGARWRVRPDGKEKVTGRLAYLTDLQAERMLYGRVLRSPYPHAWVLSIRTEAAERLPGVRAVATWKDVPGLNKFGIAFPHQPVFCRDRVLYVGDAIAAVAADSDEIAERALSLIEVDYEELPPIDDPEAALRPESPKLHPDGNVLHRTEYRIGDPDAAFEHCAVVVEETYYTPRQMHTYMETEGGLFVPEPDGRLTSYSATQHGLMDLMQLSRILAIPEERIRVVSSPIGGSFGGKDELNVQPYGAILALKTGRPVKLHNSRTESVRAGLKRHPMKIAMKTGVDADGRLVAHRVRIVSDTGAYATLGAEVLNFATEHVVGPYRIEHVDVEGVAVYTNNGVSGEFRGFGGNQAIYALEGQMDRLAAALGMETWTFRSLNLRQYGDPGPLGQRIAQTRGAEQVWEALTKSELYRSGSGTPSDARPWIRTGVGAAIAMHGAGLGFGIPDPGGGVLRLAEDGKIEAIFGYEEFGQGLLATLEQMMTEQFGFAADDLRLVIGDTDVVPNSGSSTASRATSMMWMALRRLRPVFEERLLAEASAAAGLPASALRLGAGGVRAADEEGAIVVSYERLAQTVREPIRCETKLHYPLTPDERVGAHFLYTYAAAAVKVEVDTLTGRVRVLDQYHAVAAGPVANPQGYLGQIEGGSGMAIGFTIMEDAVMRESRYMTTNLDTYLVPTVLDMKGSIQVEAIEELPEDDAYGPRGIGEIGTVALAPAICEAVYQAVGRRLAKLPIDPAELQEMPAFTRDKGGGTDHDG